MASQHHAARNLVSAVLCRSYEPEEIESALRSLLAPLLLRDKNLLAGFVKPGNTVLIKPNWIKERHETRTEEWESVISHPRVLTSLLTFVAQALQGEGRVIIADGPQTDSSFQEILNHMPTEEWHRMAKDFGVDFQIVDLREEQWISENGIIVKRRTLSGDPVGSVTFDLGLASAFSEKITPPLGYCGADYKTDETTLAHSGGRNLYRVSRSAIDADVFINLPKLKTHRKAGITACMKNLVGINTHRNFLPHHAAGTPEQGGDAFPVHSSKTSVEQALVSRLKKLWAKHPFIAKFFVPIKPLGIWLFGDNLSVIRSGNWYGNDTLWRTIVDLNRILLFGNPDGSLRPGGMPQAKRYLAIVDGIIAGEGNGPLAPDRLDAGLLIAGTNPLAVDCTVARFMGFDYRCIPYLNRSFGRSAYPIADLAYEDIAVRSDNPAWNKPLKDISPESAFRFRPSPGWEGHIELRKDQA